MITIELRKLRHLKIAPMVLGMLFLLCLFNIGNFGANRIKDLAAPHPAPSAAPNSPSSRSFSSPSPW